MLQFPSCLLETLHPKQGKINPFCSQRGWVKNSLCEGHSSPSPFESKSTTYQRDSAPTWVEINPTSSALAFKEAGLKKSIPKSKQKSKVGFQDGFFSASPQVAVTCGLPCWLIGEAGRKYCKWQSYDRRVFGNLPLVQSTQIAITWLEGWCNSHKFGHGS